MTRLELLAPARNAEIGIAAIDCGADAVYIAGPAFGARKDAGNPIESIRPLCVHAHKFGAKVFVTFNIAVRDDELPQMHAMMLAARDAGADAFIIRDERVTLWPDLGVPLHASTQCAIRTPERARRYEDLGCGRIVLERELSLEDIRKIRGAVGCEIEAFVHGALCVCYSGECRLSEKIDGRSADRGECIQACRSLYDVVDSDGRVLLRDKAILSLRDLNLLDRLEEMADAGVMSFKIEGRLKNASYVKNVVRNYSMALDALVRKYPDRYCRASFGSVSAPFEPALEKTFNRAYTSLFLDGKRDRWSSMDAPKSMGERIGTVRGVRRIGPRMEILVDLSRGVALSNADGFCFVRGSRIVGFRGDVCEGPRIVAKAVDSIKPGDVLYRNISAEFEKSLEKPCRRELAVDIYVKVSGRFCVTLEARCEDGRVAVSPFNADVETAENRERAEALLREGLSKRVDHFNCRVVGFDAAGALPLLSASTVNAMRRAVVSDLAFPQGAAAAAVSALDGASGASSAAYGASGACGVPAAAAASALDGASGAASAAYGASGAASAACASSAAPAAGAVSALDGASGASSTAYGASGACGVLAATTASAAPALDGASGASGASPVPQPSRVPPVPQPSSAPLSAGTPLMRSKYCVRFELGLCPVRQGAPDARPLYLLNNGRRFELRFDCAHCEMTLW